MSLSEQEQQMLREIEKSLLADDPRFVSSVARESGFSDAPRGGQLTLRSVALLVFGIVLLLGGVALSSLTIWAVLISVVGFGVMMAGGVMALRAPASPSRGQRPAAGGQRPRSARSVNMEENFRRRFQNPDA
ncbi:DUF3040 domain-containing protein [Corynebacterium riegelii]|uniref:DUF3040 domain-containing protein n=1 Tax=Corynebacterium riegelii TaxID=156976 RepID=A0A0K1R9J0_9CORY|nr:DUF3040 domain-containing protein [Corynebacterium riegelii]AKV58063.1 hypothetical protein AK829_01515 [Corynebacterium riegelii]